MNFKALSELMDHLTSWRIPGNSIVVTKDGKDVFSYSSGYASLEEKIPMDPHKIINIYSSSKMLTCAAALKLYEKGEFKLDDPLYDFIPEYGEMYLKNGEKAKKHITLRHLFTMSAGFNYDRNAPAFEKSRIMTEGRMDTLTVIRNLADEPLEFEPGEHYQYSFCHDVLAAVVEVVSGKKYRDYVKENIYNPLEMKESYFHNDKVRDRMAEQYCYEDGEGQNDGKIVNVGKEVGLIFGPEYDSGGAGVITTVSDYSKFTTSLANWGVGANGARILNKETVELMRRSHFNNEHHFKYHPNKALLGYGYGLGVRVMEDLKLSNSSGRLGECGWNGAAGAIAIIDPEINLSVFYSHHMINCQEDYCAPKIRNTVYDCIRR
ncbi:MAG: beta-lactamase family protein [Clostridia bacterium]|nr:beta-lactamase family protein [Clostridia bacterium]